MGPFAALFAGIGTGHAAAFLMSAGDDQNFVVQAMRVYPATWLVIVLGSGLGMVATLAPYLLGTFKIEDCLRLRHSWTGLSRTLGWWFFVEGTVCIALIFSFVFAIAGARMSSLVCL